MARHGRGTPIRPVIAPIPAGSFLRTFPDSAPATDTIAGPQGRTFTDTAPATDSFTRAPYHLTRAFLDVGGGTDSLAFFTTATPGGLKRANPNWPLVGVDADFTATAGPPDIASQLASRSSLNAAYRRLVARKLDIRRGRQYELDQVQAGTCTVGIPDPLEVLNPDNPASPLNTGGRAIVPYRPMWVWAIYPNQPGSGNLLAATVTPDADPSFAAGGTGPLDGTVSGTGSITNTTTQSWATGTDTNAVLVTQAAAGIGYGAYLRRTVVTAPTITYTASAWVYPTGGCTVAIAVVDAQGVTRTGGTAAVQNTWQRIWVPWNAVDTQERVIIYGSGTTTPAFYIDAVQLEFGAQPTAWTSAGPTLYPLFSGYIERFPTEYDMNGIRANRPLQAVDALAVLAITSIRQSYTRTIAKDSPQVVMALDESVGPPRLVGNPTAPGQTYTVEGGQIQFGGDSLPDGTPALAMSQVRPDSNLDAFINTMAAASAVGALTITVTSSSFQVGNQITIDSGTANEEWAWITSITGTASPYTLGVTRIRGAIVGLKSAHASGAQVIRRQGNDTWVSSRSHSVFPANFAGLTVEFWMKPVIGDSTIYIGENLSGAVQGFLLSAIGSNRRDTFIAIQTAASGLLLGVNDAANSSPGSVFYAGATSSRYTAFPDGEWHYYAVTVFTNPLTPTQYRWRRYIDLRVGSTAAIVGTPPLRVARFNQISAGTSATGSTTESAMSVARIAVYPYALSDAQITSHVQRGLGYKSEISGTRVARLLNAYWGGPARIAEGFLPMADDFSYDSGGQSRDVLSALQEIQESERGLVYVDAGGRVVFEDRESRYQTQTPMAVFGEDPADTGAEVPYTSIAFDYDPTYTFSQANLTSPYNGNWLPLVNPDALARYGQRVVSQQVQAVRDFDLEQAGIYYLSRYSKPRTRISKLTIKPSANPSLWPLVLSLDISQRYTVHRRTQSGTVVSGDHYVESVQHTIDPATGDWTVSLQLSPVFVPSAWVLGDATYGVLGSTTTPIY